MAFVWRHSRRTDRVHAFEDDRNYSACHIVHLDDMGIKVGKAEFARVRRCKMCERYIKRALQHKAIKLR